MKKVIRISLLCLIALMMILPGCTAEEPGYVVTTSDSEVMVVDSDGDIILIDEDTRALTIISLEHHILHEGTAFISDIVDTVMSDGDNLTLTFRTMSAPIRAHMFFEFTTLVGGYLEVWEDVTWTTGTGVVVPIYNRKRETTMTDSGLLEDLTFTPVFTATNNILDGVGGINLASATQIHHLYAWGKKEKFPGGNIRETEGFILKPDTNYAVIFYAEGNGNTAQVILNWFEHAAH